MRSWSSSETGAFLFKLHTKTVTSVPAKTTATHPPHPPRSSDKRSYLTRRSRRDAEMMVAALRGFLIATDSVWQPTMSVSYSLILSLADQCISDHAGVVQHSV